MDIVSVIVFVVFMVASAATIHVYCAIMTHCKCPKHWVSRIRVMMSVMALVVGLILSAATRDMESKRVNDPLTNAYLDAHFGPVE